ERDEVKSKWQAEKDAAEVIQEKRGETEQLKIEAEQGKRNGDLGRASESQYGLLPVTETAVEDLSSILTGIQEQSRMLKEEVTAADIAEVVGRWTGIPVTRLIASEREKLLHLEEELHKRVAGQEEGIEAVSDAIRRSRAGLHDR